MLNKLPYISDSMHHKRRHVQIAIKLLKVKYGLETTIMLRYNKHAGKETNTTRRWFCGSLSKQLIHFLLDNQTMNCSCLNIKLLEITEQRRMRPKLNMVTLNYIKHKPVGSNDPPLIKKMGKCTNLHNRRRWWWGCGLQHIRNAEPHSSPSS